MGVYINSKSAHTLYKSECDKPYFVDKSSMLQKLFPYVREENHSVCITRPRRFGKTVTANMIASFFSKGCDAEDLFQNLAIANTAGYKDYQNKYSLVHISFNELPKRCATYEAYIDRIERRRLRDLQKEYPAVDLDMDGAVWDAFTDLYDADDSARFIFVLDEWDYIFHQDFVTEADKKEYLAFLRNLLKDRPYMLFVYMTGILPIAKYSSGSELNMFTEYTMVTGEQFSDDFGFTETEVELLYRRYLNQTEHPNVTREGLRDWYNGYHTFSGERVYNPRSVVLALQNNHLGYYWTSSGPYDEIFYYVKNNVIDVRDDLAVMISGETIPAKIREYAAASMTLKTKEDIFSAMVVYGFLSYGKGMVSIPNKELMGKFEEMMQTEPSLGYVYRLARESERMLQATLAGDTDSMAEILELLHDTEVPLLSYNKEVELTAIVNLAYLSARDRYRVERDEKAGVGFADFIFYPAMDKNADILIIELKVGGTPDKAIQQIKDKKYALRLKGSTGVGMQYTGRVLAVGISYDKKQKKHRCKIEILGL
jgi:hypothetical protein